VCVHFCGTDLSIEVLRDLGIGLGSGEDRMVYWILSNGETYLLDTVWDPRLDRWVCPSLPKPRPTM
jgi:hypothetical protein